MTSEPGSQKGHGEYHNRALSILAQKRTESMDDVQQLAYDSEFSVAVLGSTDTLEYMVIPLDREGAAINEGETIVARVKGYSFAGVFGYCNGVAGVKSEPWPDAWRVMAAAAPAFIEYLAERLRLKADGGDFLESLWSLEDPRD